MTGLFVDDMRTDVKGLISLSGSQTNFESKAGSVIRNVWGEVSEWDEPITGDPTYAILTLDQVHDTDPGVVDPGGPDGDRYLRVDYTPSDGPWVLASTASAPVHDGNTVVIEGQILVPDGMSGADLSAAAVDGDGNTSWDAMYLSWAGHSSDTDGEWVDLIGIGRAAIGGSMHLFITGWSPSSPGHFYLKNLRISPGRPRLLYASNFAETIDEWVASSHNQTSIEMARADGVPALRLTSEGNSGSASVPPIPHRLGERHLIEFDIWAPDGGPVPSGTLSIGENADPVGAASVSFGSNMSGQPGRWTRISQGYNPGESLALGSPTALQRNYTPTIGVSWGETATPKEGFIANVQIQGVRPSPEHRIGFDPDWQTSRLIDGSSVSYRVPRGEPGDRLVAFALSTHGFDAPPGFTRIVHEAEGAGAAQRVLQVFVKDRAEVEVPGSFTGPADNHGIVVIGNAPPQSLAIVCNEALGGTGSEEFGTAPLGGGVAIGAVWIRGGDPIGIAPLAGDAYAFDSYIDHMRRGTWPGETAFDRIGIFVQATTLGSPASFRATAEAANVIERAVVLGSVAAT